MNELLSIQGDISLEKIATIRNFYELFLWELYTNMHTYKELYSITSPFAINYDDKTSESLLQVVKNIYHIV